MTSLLRNRPGQEQVVEQFHPVWPVHIYQTDSSAHDDNLPARILLANPVPAPGFAECFNINRCWRARRRP
jgi:hypothetical protein